MTILVFLLTVGFSFVLLVILICVGLVLAGNDSKPVDLCSSFADDHPCRKCKYFSGDLFVMCSINHESAFNRRICDDYDEFEALPRNSDEL